MYSTAMVTGTAGLTGTASSGKGAAGIIAGIAKTGRASAGAMMASIVTSAVADQVTAIGAQMTGAVKGAVIVVVIAAVRGPVTIAVRANPTQQMMVGAGLTIGAETGVASGAETIPALPGVVGALRWEPHLPLRRRRVVADKDPLPQCRPLRRLPRDLRPAQNRVHRVRLLISGPDDGYRVKSNSHGRPSRPACPLPRVHGGGLLHR